ncbi:centromere-associated protein E-like [Mya arenaria]|uniref:centromere-associated protein E-like n=1 Tax=Mya arenaria TaxID=6604 RepID=UPI0022E19AE0|nr:centromere-associated protein E-like [Mya arenaria]
MSSDNIKVAIRVRNLIQKELSTGLKSHWTVRDNIIVCNESDSNGRKPSPYTFDRVFDESTVTCDIFDEVCKPIVDSALAGFNGTIFAYGQSSSGKTFTMSGTRVQLGIISLAVEEIFSSINNIPDREFLIRVGYMEIYNEKVSDLLSDSDQNLKLQEDVNHNIQIVGLSEVMVKDTQSVNDTITKGNKKRHTAETKQNDRSSRSHCILRFVIESRQVGHEDEAVNVSNLYFVDLAGSEKAGDNSGDRFREGCAINRSLFTLGNVIRKLSGDANLQHVTFRDSKLTRILQNALGGNSKTAIICTITPAHIEESDSTLKFASRAKNIVNKTHVNEVMSDEAMLKKMRRQIQNLQAHISKMNDVDVHLEKVELEKQLAEKEEYHRQQTEIISKLQNMIVTAGSNTPNDNKPARKTRRETWCPGKAKREFGMPQFSPLGASDYKKRKIVPLPSDLQNSVFEEEDSLQLLDNMAMSGGDSLQENLWQAANGVADDTIQTNPVTKELFKLQDEHELLLEELQRKQQDMAELQEFTELERGCLEDTITQLKLDLDLKNSELKKTHALLDQNTAQMSNVTWLEEELMKSQKERNTLRQKMEAVNRQLSLVEDGTGLSKKVHELASSEAKVSDLNSELDIQKSKYEFHIDQLKKKLEQYTLMLEEKGVNPEELKIRNVDEELGSTCVKRIGSISETDDDKQLKEKYEHEVTDLRNEIDMLMINLEKEKNVANELQKQFDVEFDEMKAQHKKDQEEIREEIEIYQHLLQEEKSKYAENMEKLKNELNAYKDNISDTEKESDKNLEIDEAVNTIRKEYEMKIEELQATVSSRISAEELDKVKEEYEDKLQGIKNELQENERVKEQKGELERIPTPIDDKEQVSTEREQEIEQMKIELEAKIEELQISLGNEKQGLTEKEQEIEQMRKEFEARIEELHTSLESKEQVSNKSEAALKAKFESELNELKASYVNTQRICSVADMQCQTDKFRHVSFNLASELDELKRQIKELTEERDAYMALLDESAQGGNSDSVSEELLKKIVQKDEDLTQMKVKYESRIKELEENLFDLTMHSKVNVKESAEVESETNLQAELLRGEIAALKDGHKKELEKIKEDLNLEHENRLKEETKKLESLLESVDERRVDHEEHNNMKSEYQVQIQDLNEEIKIYRDLLEEGKQKREAAKNNGQNDATANNDNNEAKFVTEIERLEEEARKYEALFEAEKAKHVDEVNSDISSELNELKESHAREIEMLKTEFQKFAEQHFDGEQEIKRVYEEEIIVLRKEIEDLSNKLESIQESKEAAEGASDGVTKIREEFDAAKERYENEIEHLKNKLESVNKHTPDMASDLQTEMLRAEISDLKAKHTEQIEELTGNLKALTKELETTKDAPTGGEDLQTELLRTELTEMKERHSDEVEDLRRQLEDRNNTTGVKSFSLEESMSCTDLDQSIRDLREKNKQLETSQIEERDNSKKQMALYESTIEELHVDLSAMRSQLEQLFSDMQVLQDANTRLKHEKLNLINMREQLENASTKHEELIIELKAEIQHLNEEKYNLRTRINSLEENKKDKEESQDNLENVTGEQTQELKENMHRIEAQLAEVMEENDLLQEKLRDAKNNVETMTEKVEEAETYVKVLEEKLSETKMKSDIPGSKEGTEEITKVKEQLKQAFAELESAKQELKRSMDNENNLEFKLREGKEHTEQLEEELRMAAENKNILEEKLKSSKESLADINEQLMQANDEIIDLGEQLYKVKEKFEELQKELSESREQMEFSEKQLLDANLTIDALKEQLAHANDKIEEMELTESQFSDKILKLESEIVGCAEYEEKIVTLETDLDLYKSKVSDLEETCKDLELLTERLKGDLEIAQNTDIELKDVQTKYQEAIDKLESDLKLSNNQLKDLEEAHKSVECELKEAKCEIESKSLDVQRSVEDAETHKLAFQDISLEKEDVAKELEATRQQIKLMKSENSRIETELEDAKAKISCLTDNIEKLTLESNCSVALEEKMAQLQEQVLCTEEDRVKLEKKVEELNVILEAGQEKVRELEVQNEQLEHDKVDLTAQVEMEGGEMKNQLEEIRAKLIETEQTIESLESDKVGLQEDIFQLEQGRELVLKYPVDPVNFSWEKKWREFVIVEKLKRKAVYKENTTLKQSLEEAETRRKNAFKEAFEEAQKQVKSEELYQKLKADLKSVNAEADKLHSDLQDERKVTQQLRDELEKGTSAGQEQGIAKQDMDFMTEDHPCKYKLQSFSASEELRKASEEFEKRVVQYKETIDQYEARISRMKNEMRRLQNLDNTFDVRTLKPPSFEENNSFRADTSENQSGMESKADTNQSSSLTGQHSASGGIMDHFKVCLVEAENKRLKQEVERMKKRVAHWEEFDKENVSVETLRQLRHMADKGKKLEGKNASLQAELKKLKEKSGSPAKNSTSKYLRDMFPVDSPSQTNSLRETPSPRKAPGPRYHVPDLNPSKKKTDEPDNCKAQ